MNIKIQLNTVRDHKGDFEVWLQSNDPVIESTLPYLIKYKSLYFVPHYSWDVIGDLLVINTDEKRLEIVLQGYTFFMSDFYEISSIIKMVDKKRRSGVQVLFLKNY